MAVSVEVGSSTIDVTLKLVQFKVGWTSLLLHPVFTDQFFGFLIMKLYRYLFRLTGYPFATPIDFISLT